MPQDRPTALLSVTDKTGLDKLAQALCDAGYRLVATSKTAQALHTAGFEVDEVDSLTGFPPLLGGRLKTLHPVVFGGILAREGTRDANDLQRIGAPCIDVVAVNLYKFAQALARRNIAEPELLEEIDIGGVALLRAAAKNFISVSVLCDPSLYEEFIAAQRRGGPTPAERKLWAGKAFETVARYDAGIASYFSATGKQELPEALSLQMPMESRLRYGENPWAKAAYYHAGAAGLPEQRSGKTLSYNNLIDVDTCLRLIAPIEEPRGFAANALPAKPVVAAIVKHTIPCGMAAAQNSAEALSGALGTDPISAFGGIVAVNATLDEAAAIILKPRFLDVVAAPAFEPTALEILKKKKQLRVLRFDPQLPAALRSQMTLRSALGGVLAEQPDPQAAPDEWRVMTDRQPDARMWRDLLFAFGVVRQVKSNAAVVTRDQITLGICGGQTNRVVAVELACQRAGKHVIGATLATDGFFPFADGIEAAIASGIAAVVAPSGSIRDSLVIEAAQKANIILIFASRRYFLH